MLGFGREGTFKMLLSSIVLVLLVTSVGSSTDSHRSIQSSKAGEHRHLELTPQLSFQVKLHSFLLWASVGFLMPIGILIIRMSNRVECGRNLKIIFYSHVILQITAVLLATAGAVLSIKNFENSFDNTHQRMGLALYACIWIQPLIGFYRPHRGVKVRSLWYFVHWLLGTGICVLGIINIYIGLHTYHERTSKSVKLWTVLFTAEVSIFAFLYLFQDRWDYMMKQGVILGDEQITPTDPVASPRNNHKAAVVMS